MSFIYLTRDSKGVFFGGGKDYTAKQAADLIKREPFATANRHYGDIIASDDRAKVARYGIPRTGAELAARLRDDSRAAESRRRS